MTLREGKDKVYMLLDEHSSGGEIEHDADLENKMACFFDIAQKEMAKIKKILKVFAVRPAAETEEYEMPADFSAVFRISADGGNARRRFRWKGRSLVIPRHSGVREVTVEYFAVPATIDENTPDDYEFELPEDACSAMPYYVAAQQLLPDPVLDCSVYLQMWQLSLSTLNTGLPGDIGAIRQTLFS